MTDGEIVPAWDMHVMIAALKSDRSDVASYARVLTSTLGDALPEDMVEIEYRKTMADRVGGRAGQPIAVRVFGTDRQLELRQGKRGVDAEIRKIVRDVVISRKKVGIDEWLAGLAEELAKVAQSSAAARAALSRLIDG
ncbi:MAG TPA: hypothetical protein VHX38_10965 [Pseudonocardiaceae bacterium]|nr:hypothetical protein [Pseudonocardiaceae bacterium]